MPTAVQMNIRIDSDLKAAGDAALKSRGISPSEAIRRLYQSLIGGGKKAERALEVVSTKPNEKELSEEAQRKLDSIRAIQSSVVELIGEGPYPEIPKTAEEDKQLLEEALWERMVKKGMVSR